MAQKGAYKKFCKWIYGHKQSGSNITTRGDYIITQYYSTLFGLTIYDDYEGGTSSSDPSKNWTWAENGNDGAHAFAMSNTYYTIDYKGYPDPIIKASGSTYYIDYGAVDMSYQTNHLLVNPDCAELPCPAGTANQGTYYNHTAASAGSSFLKNSTDFWDKHAPDSICPKGWMLPTRLEDSNKSFANLVKNAYGEVREGTGLGNKADVIALYPPLSFLRSGYYNYSTTGIINPGISGQFWGSWLNTAGSNASVLFFFPSNNALRHQHSVNRALGNPLRCVSRS